jgi:hypothetical protein
LTERKFVSELDVDSPTIKQINSQFAHAASTENVLLVSYCESRPTPLHKVSPS